MPKPDVFVFDDEFVPRTSSRLVPVPAGITSKAALFAELRKGLELPDYFGGNWDALEECLRDLSWLEEETIYLVHADVPELDRDDLRTYLEVLKSAVLDWRDSDKHGLVVAFPGSAEADVDLLLLS